MRTTITLDDDVATRVKEICRRTGKSFKSVLNETLRAGLSAPKSLKPKKSFRVKARPLGLRPGLSYDNVAELIELIETS
jgi:hypothetical protein